MKHKSHGILIVLLTLYLLASPTSDARAVFSLSVRPFEGGFDLRFGKVSAATGRINKEVVVSVTSDTGSQYQLVQTFLEPLSSAEGALLSPVNFVFYGLRGTNRFGTINVEQEQPVSLGRQVLYTSNRDGAPDTLTLIYGVVPGEGMKPGSYRGRIAITLEPIDSAQPPVTEILNVFAEVDVASSVRITTETASGEISLRTDRPQDARIVFEITGGFGNQYRILQVVDQQPFSAEGGILDYAAVSFRGSGGGRGMVINQSSPLSASPQTIYTSSPGGDADSFILEYSLDPSVRQPAGRYRGRVGFVLEGAGTVHTRVLGAVGVDVEYVPIFELSIAPEEGGFIKFTDVKMGQPPKSSEATVAIRTNLGRRYQVTQHLASGLVNKEGREIPSNYFTLREESIATKGELFFPQPASVKSGETVIFISDKAGSPDSFKVIYELMAAAEVIAGDYATRITYSISEL